MYRIFFVATLGFTLTLSPVLIFDGAADAKGGEGASSGGSSSGNGKGKSGQSGSSNSGSSNKGAGVKGAAGPSGDGPSAAKGSADKGSSNAGGNGSASDGGKGKSGQSGPSNSGSSNNGAGGKGAAGPSGGGQSAPKGSPSTMRHPMPEGAGRHQGARANPARAALPTAALPTMVQVPRALLEQALGASRPLGVPARTQPPPMPGSERVDIRGREGQIRPERLFEQRCKRHRRSKRWGPERFFPECRQRQGRCRSKPKQRSAIPYSGWCQYAERRRGHDKSRRSGNSERGGAGLRGRAHNRVARGPRPFAGPTET